MIEGIAHVLTKCAALTVVDGKDRTPMTMTGLSFPNLGDQTLAFRAKAKSEGIDIVVDIGFVAIGHNIVSFTAAGLQPLAGPETVKIAHTGMAKDAAAAKS